MLETMRVTLIHNPRAGGDEHGGERLVGLLREFGHQVQYQSTERSWRAALADPGECVAVAGGDGTVANVARSLAGRGVPIAVLPAGTANNIADALGLGASPLRALVAGWSDAVPRPFDLGTARGPWGETQFLESVGAGVLSDTIADIDLGGSGHVNEIDDPDARMAAAVDVFERVLRTATPVRYELTLDGRQLVGEYLMVEALNFGAAGPKLRFAHSSDGTDGLLDVVMVDESTRDVLLTRLTRHRTDSGRPLRLPMVQARRVAVACDRCAFHVDDRVHDRDTGGQVRVEASLQPGAVTFLVPRTVALPRDGKSDPR